MRQITAEIIRKELSELCGKSSQRQVAKKLGFSAAFIGDVLHSRRDVTEKLALSLGYKIKIHYVHTHKLLKK